jgi:hypothetical protein
MADTPNLPPDADRHQAETMSRQAELNTNSGIYSTINSPVSPEMDARNSAAGIQQKAESQYSQDDAQADLDTHADRQTAVADEYTMTPEQWFKMYGYWNWNLAKHNPNGNLNNRSFGKTLGLSRLADALNNQRHWRAAQIGRRTNSGFGTHEYTPGYSERWEPIETQEMRQMRADERTDEAQRNRQVNRAENVQDYPLELQKMTDQSRMRINEQVTSSLIDLERAFQKGTYSAEYEQSWQNFWQNFAFAFSAEFPIQLRTQIFNKMYNMSPSARELFMNVMSMGGNIDDYKNMLYDMMWSATGQSVSRGGNYFASAFNAFNTVSRAVDQNNNQLVHSGYNDGYDQTPVN